MALIKDYSLPEAKRYGDSLEPKKTNDLRKHNWVLLENGWKAKIVDNRKGNTRDCLVYGDFRETGSVYSHDMVRWGYEENNIVGKVVHTPAQLKLKERVKQFSATRF